MNDTLTTTGSSSPVVTAGAGFDASDMQDTTENIDFSNRYEWIRETYGPATLLRYRDGNKAVRYVNLGPVPVKPGVALRNQFNFSRFISGLTDFLSNSAENIPVEKRVYKYYEFGLYSFVTLEDLMSAYTTNLLGYVGAAYEGELLGRVHRPSRGYAAFQFEDGQCRLWTPEIHPDVMRDYRKFQYNSGLPTEKVTDNRNKLLDTYYRYVAISTYLKQGYVCLKVVNDNERAYLDTVVENTWSKWGTTEAVAATYRAKTAGAIGNKAFSTGTTIDKVEQNGGTPAPEIYNAEGKLVIAGVVIEPNVAYCIKRQGVPVARKLELPDDLRLAKGLAKQAADAFAKAGKQIYSAENLS